MWKVIKKTKKKVARFQFQLQDNQSTSCGAWVCFFGYCLTRGFSAADIVKHFFNADARDAAQFKNVEENAYKRDLFVSFSISHLFPKVREIRSAEKNLFNYKFFLEQKKKEKERVSGDKE